MWNTIVFYWLFFIGTIGSLERAHLARTAADASKIAIGSSEDEVIGMIGEPLCTYAQFDGWTILGFGAHPPQWLYGTTINLKRMFIPEVNMMPSPLPINIRLFSYDDGDLVVEWNAKKRVSKITIPNIEIDHRADKLLDSIYLWHSIYLTLAKQLL
jgi:hypothetical protein